ncbi:SAM-dependent methyltransferase [Paremcibacter congregatus]|uniref:SAM-dependent methyltransferase n=1 Tax=Paremcibacter congregatus TaxID=2043170 RepID=A0A2G4YU08_9PROT|nr:class I SAM-dependent methyltransferase [Paremcibacter congregatus]PHZ85815.1 SAM-dependent methyltransferase [Paremcibacter congregatus]QDE26778.1 class I SAM-dependent methyltransferase [Paremcibacter congregatus]
METVEFWNARFGTEAYAYGTAPNDFLQQMADQIPTGGRVLCIAEGEGRNAVYLAQQGHRVSAVDISAAGQKKAERLAREKGVVIDYHLSDLDQFDLGEGRWDAIISIFGYIGRDAVARQSVYSELQKALTPGGVLIVEAYHPEQLNYNTGGPKESDLLITLDELRGAFDKDAVLHAAACERNVIEGVHHTGPAFVTQLVYQKPM